MTGEGYRQDKNFSRRKVLEIFGGFALGGVLTGCGSDHLGRRNRVFQGEEQLSEDSRSELDEVAKDYAKRVVEDLNDDNTKMTQPDVLESIGDSKGRTIKIIRHKQGGTTTLSISVLQDSMIINDKGVVVLSGESLLTTVDFTVPDLTSMDLDSIEFALGHESTQAMRLNQTGKKGDKVEWIDDVKIDAGNKAVTFSVDRGEGAVNRMKDSLKKQKN